MPTPPAPIKIGPFNLGFNNRLPDHQLTVPKVGAFLRSAVNVDLDVQGTVKRREGFTLSAAGDDAHSLYSAGEIAYVVDGTTLFALTGSADALAKTPIREGLARGRRLSFTSMNLTTVYTDGASVRQLKWMSDMPLGVPKISPEPDVSATAGDLPEGDYQVCFTFFDANFQQSGSTVPVAVSGTGVAVSNLPAAFPAGVAGVMMFMTAPGGDVLFRTAVLDAPQTSLAVTSAPDLAEQCQTLLLNPMPGGSILRHAGGRLLVASGNFLFYSEPYSNLYDPTKNFIPFASEVTMVEPSGSGVFVATSDETYYLAGDVADAEMASKLPYGAVPGTSGSSPDNNHCWWMSSRGMVRGDESGNVKNVQEGSVAVNAALSGASLFREQDGNKHVVSSLSGTDASGASAYSYMQAEIVRKGTTL